MSNPLKNDPVLRQAVKDLRRTIQESNRKRPAPQPRTHFVPDRIWKDGKIIAEPACDDR